MAQIFTTTRLPCAPSAPALHRRPVPIARCPARTAPHVGRTARPVRVVCSVAVASARRSYYETLGVPDNASIRDVKEAFRRLALEWHPDRNQLPGAKEKFMEFKEAYDTLSDFALRAKYDQQLRQSRGPAPGTPGFPWGNTRVTSPMRRAGSVRRTASNYATAPPAPAAQTVDRDRQFFEYQPPSGAAQPPPPPQPVAPPKPVDRDRMFFDYNPAATGVPQTAAGPANGTPVFTRTSASIFPSAAQQPPSAAAASPYVRSGTAARSTSPTRSTSRSRTVRRVANVPPVSQPYHQPYAQPVTRPGSQPVSQPVSRPAGPPAGYPPSVQQWPAASWPPPATHSSSAQAQATPPPKPATVIPTATAASATASTPTAAAPKPPQQTPVAPKETWSRGATAVWPPPGLGGEGFRIAVNQPAAPPAPQAQQASQPSPQPVRQPTHTQDASATTRPPSPASHAAATSSAMASAQAAPARPQSQPRSKQPASTGVWAGTWDSLASLMDFKM